MPTDSEQLVIHMENYLKKLKELKEEDPKKVKEICEKSLINMGLIDEEGKLLPPYNGEKVNDNDFTRGPKKIKR